MSPRRTWERYGGLISGFLTASALLAGLAAPASSVASGPRYGTLGWAGYAWTPSSPQVTASLRLPTVSADRNAGAAFWAGFGAGPGIEQTGLTANMTGGHLRWTAWYELYPAPAVGFGPAAYSGDYVTMTVSHNATGWFKLTVHDATRNWTASVVRHASTVTVNTAEVIAEAYGPPLARFSPVTFSNVPASYGRAYTMPGAHVSPLRQHSFQVHR